MDVHSLCPLRVASLRYQPTRGRWTLIVVAKATFRLEPGTCPLAEAQEDPNEHENHWDDDVRRSLYSPCDLVPFKPMAEVTLVGNAFAPRGGSVPRLVARLVVGKVDKAITVHGNRSFAQGGAARPGVPFRQMPLRYERAAGGPETANPVGMTRVKDGFGAVHLPNLEPLGAGVSHPDDFIEPIGFGPIAADWPTRREKLGDLRWAGEAWRKEPLPERLDPRYFMSAPPDQYLDELRPNERLLLENLHPEHPRLATSLPGTVPRAFIDRPRSASQKLAMTCDTLWIDTDRSLCTLTWRAQVALEKRDEGGRVMVGMEQMDRPVDRTHVVPRTPRAAGGQYAAVPAADGEPEEGMPTLALVEGEHTQSIVEEESFLTQGLTQDTDPLESVAPAKPLLHPGLPFAKAGSVPAATPSKRGKTVEMPATASRRGKTVELPAAAVVASVQVPAPVVAPPVQVPAPVVAPPVQVLAPAVVAPVQVLAPAVVAPVQLPVPPVQVPAPAVLPPAPPVSLPVPLAADAAAPPLMTLGQRAAASHSSLPAVGSPRSSEATARKSSPGLPFAQLRDAAAGGAVAASNAAAASEASEPARDDRAASSQPAAAREPARDHVDLLWYDAEALPRIRAAKAFNEARPGRAGAVWLSGSAPRDSQETKERREAIGYLSRPAELDEAGLRQVAWASYQEDGTFAAPLALIAGELAFAFDELETLRATITVASPFSGADKKLKDLITAGTELLKSEWRVPGDIAEGMTRRIEEAFVQGQRATPPRYLETSVEKILLEGRSYQKKTLFGAPRIRSFFSFAAGGAAIPAYLPEDLATKLPLFRRFKAKAIVEVRPQEDQYETHTESLLVLAVGRLLRRAGEAWRGG